MGFLKIFGAIIFGADISSSVHVDSRKKDILIVGKGPVQGLHNTALIAEREREF